MTEFREMTEGDLVTVLAVPAGLVKGLPDRERRFIVSLVGETVVVSQADADNVEIEAWDRDGAIHYLRLAASDVSSEAAVAAPRG